MTKKRKIGLIGAGIVGLAVARAWRRFYPDDEITIHEKESEIAVHQTGHNSGVIHSGIYYPPGSEKARRCRQGAEMMRRFCEQNGIPRRVCGKLIVATNAAEVPGLGRLAEQGRVNGIPGVEVISREEISEREPAIAGLGAVWIPGVEIVDYRRVAAALREELVSAGAQFEFHTRVERVEESSRDVVLVTDRGFDAFDFIVNCAGLYSDRIARASRAAIDVRIIPFRGEYYYLRDELAKKVKAMIYPVPDPRFPFLGVHLTPTPDFRVSVGPNAVLALAREGYRWSRIELSDIADYALYPGFWRMAFRHSFTGIYEAARSIVKGLYAGSVRRYMPEVRTDDLVGRASGVRAQAVDTQGRMIHDFLYQRTRRVLHVLNAPSPAATASLAIAERIIDLARDDG